ncbi:MAG TPA: cytochrome c [Acidobacteriaceae bacterium]
MLKPFLTLAVFAVCGFPAMVPAMLQDSQSPNAATPAPETKAPSVAANQVNPVHPTPQSLARAKAIYGYDCAMCHGVNGDGKGDMNADGKMKITDLRDPASLKGLSDADIYNIIEVGKPDMPDMPPEDGRAKPEEVWNLVIYLRSLSGAPRGGGQP